MRCSRQTMRSHWIAVGKQAANMGKTLESVTSPIRADQLAVRQWLTEGWEFQMRKHVRKLLTTNVRDA